ncbi:MAG: OB-fold nucleic acid binding domain-containing protein [Arachnia sp.]
MTHIGQAKGLGARLRRWFASAEELQAEELGKRARGCGAVTLADAAPRTMVKLRGSVATMLPGDGQRWLEAQLDDGTGTVRLVWMGHRQLTCIQPGRELIVCGRLSCDDAGPVIYNPSYEVVS